METSYYINLEDDSFLLPGVVQVICNPGFKKIENDQLASMVNTLFPSNTLDGQPIFIFCSCN